MKGKYKGVDRRDSVRLSRVLPAKFKLIDEVKSKDLTKMNPGIIRNISAGGVLLETGELNEAWIEGLALGTIQVVLEIQLPDTPKVVKVLARTAWFSKIGKDKQVEQEKYIIGLRFVDITTANQDLIRDYIIKSYLS